MLNASQAEPVAEPVRRAGKLPFTASRPVPAESDRELVVRSQAGDRSAFERIVSANARLIYARLYLETGNPHRAEDLAQETFLIAWRNIRQVTDPAGLRTWLLSIARSALIDADRRDRRHKRGGKSAPARDEGMDRAVAPGPIPLESAEQAERRSRVLTALRAMPEEYRLPITLRYIGGADYDTIRAQLGLTEGALRGLLHRGLARLRDVIKIWEL